MQMKWMPYALFVLIATLAFNPAVVLASQSAQTQTGAAAQVQQATPAPGLTDFGVSFYGTFNRATSGHGTTEAPSNSAGGLVELRHISMPLLGYEMTYSFNPGKETLSPTAACTYLCTNPPTTITTDVSELTADWVVSKQYGGLRPFALAGIGFLITAATGSQYDLNTVVKPVYVFGGGADWSFSQRLGLRLQFRENIAKAPQVSGLYYPTGAFTETAEPMLGVFYRF